MRLVPGDIVTGPFGLFLMTGTILLVVSVIDRLSAIERVESFQFVRCLRSDTTSLFETVIFDDEHVDVLMRERLSTNE